MLFIGSTQEEKKTAVVCCVDPTTWSRVDLPKIIYKNICWKTAIFRYQTNKTETQPKPVNGGRGTSWKNKEAMVKKRVR